MVLERFQSGRRQRVDRVGSDQLLDVQHVAVARVLGAGACPQRPLHLRTTRFERLPRGAAEDVQEPPMGQLGIGTWVSAQRLAVSRRRAGQICRQQLVDQGVDATDEEAGHRHRRRLQRARVAQRLSRAEEALEPRDIGVRDLLVQLDREQQRHIDVDARGNRLFDRWEPAGVAGILIITLGRSSRVHRSRAMSIVAWVSLATDGAHSRLT